MALSRPKDEEDGWGILTEDDPDLKSVRNYVFTAWSDPLSWVSKIAKCSYICWGEEITPTTGKWHAQGYLELSKDRSISAIRKDIGEVKIYFAARWASQERAIKYTQKTALSEGKWWEFGEKKSQGKRNDLLRLRDLCKMQASDRRMLDEVPEQWFRYNKAIDRAKQAYQTHRDGSWLPTVKVFWGQAGAGKSRAAFEIAQLGYGDNYDSCKYRNGFILGYENSPCVVFDDFNPKSWTREDFLTICDRYKLVVNVKTTEKKFNAKVIIFTSNYDPRFWFGEVSNDGQTTTADEAVVRRLFEEPTAEVVACKKTKLKIQAYVPEGNIGLQEHVLSD